MKKKKDLIKELFVLYYLSNKDYSFELRLDLEDNLYVKYPNGEKEKITEKKLKSIQGSETIYLEYLEGISKIKKKEKK